MRAMLMAGLLSGAITTAAAGQAVERVDAAQQPRTGVNAGGRRARLEAQFRQSLARRARVELGLNQDQMIKLSESERRFAPQQRMLDQQENATRRLLRAALLEKPSADQDRRVGELHDQVFQLQRQRLDLVAAQQKDLSGFLTNAQRIRFQALKDNIRRQIQQDLGRGGGPPPGGRVGPPPPR